MVRQFLNMQIIVALVLMAAPAWADEPEAAAGDFKQLHAEWQKLDVDLTALAQRYSGTADQAEREKLRADYVALVEQSETLLPKLRAAAVAELEKGGELDKNVQQVLIGMVGYDYRRDDYEGALKLAQRMFDAKVDEPALYGLAGMAAYGMDDFQTAEKYLTLASEAGRLNQDGQQFLASLPDEKKKWAEEKAVRAKEADTDDLPRVKLTTSKGPVVIELFENQAPNAVANFISLVEKKYYDGLTFHRVLGNFMAQGGDPTGTGSGGPGYNIACECYRDDARDHFRGTLSMAHAGRDTGGSQFFLTFRPTPHLDGRHTAFGRVIEGFDVLHKLQRRDPNSANPPEPDRIVKAEVVRKRDHEYKPQTLPE